MDNKQDILWWVMHEFCYAGSEKYNYYRHSDHLGSANWITDQDGHAVQYLHYLPYGELLLNQQVAGYDERYKFTDKERDAESGYDYFGARYYASPLYNWTSVDPLADQSPQISPYAYCNWNPIKFIDPDGKEIIVGTWYGRVLAKLGFNNYEAKVQSHLNELKAMDPQVNNMIINLENSENNHVIRHPKSKWNTAKPVNGEDFKNNKRQGSIVDYDPDNWETKNGDRRDPKAGLSHELQHSLDIDQGNGSIEKINDIPIMEIDAINMENKVRHQTGDTKRTTYGGKEIPNNMLD